MRNWLVGIVVIVIVGAVGFFIMSRPAQSPSSESSKTESPQSTKEDSSSNQAESANTKTIDIQDFTYMQQTMTVKKGTTVTWTNQDSARHNVVSESDSPQKGLSSSLLGKGETYSFTFNTAGTYKYYCTPHASMASMHATITVTE